jgi:hypothetical protein
MKRKYLTQITVATHAGWARIEASPLRLEGIPLPLAIHRSFIHASKWTVTERTTGRTLARGTTRKAAIAAAAALAERGETALRQLVAAYPVAPPPETVEPLSLPMPKAAKRVNLDPIIDAIADNMVRHTDRGLDDRERAAVRSALSTTTGRLKASAPSEDWGKAAWNGLQPNAWKVQWSACWIAADAREFLRRLASVPWPAALDKDLDALRRMGVA